MLSAYDGTDIISYLRSKYIIPFIVYHITTTTYHYKTYGTFAKKLTLHTAYSHRVIGFLNLQYRR